jgi:S-adenosylmethionine hydrolase
VSLREVRPIGLLTDFGLQDWYVAAMKGEILKHDPGSRIIDLCHVIPAHRVECAAFMLGCLLDSLPEGMVICCVVDPGVGTDRRAVCGEIGPWFFVGPDNGLMTPLIQRAGARIALYEIQDASFRSTVVSRTFHGRDVFAHAAARIAAGTPPDRVGLPLDHPVLLNTLGAEVHSDGLTGRVMLVDRFGNLVTNVSRDQFEGEFNSRQFTIRAGRLRLNSINNTYGEVRYAQALAYWGSAGYLEIGVNLGSASEMTGLQAGDLVFITGQT